VRKNKTNKLEIQIRNASINTDVDYTGMFHTLFILFDSKCQIKKKLICLRINPKY